MTKKAVYLRYLLIALLLGATYSYICYWLYVRWSSEDSFFSHGYLIPFVSIWLCVRRKQILSKIESKPDLRGLYLLIPALVFHIMAVYKEVYSPSGMTIPVVIAGVIMYLHGWDMLRALIFPVVYLYSAIPLPLSWISVASYNLKIAAINLSTTISGLFGAHIREKGSYLIFDNGSTLLVGSPCSGLRSLIALIALGVLYAIEFSRLNVLGITIFIIITGPIAYLSNVLRITFLCLTADNFGASSITGFVHDASGYGIYIIAFLMMLGLGWLLSLFSCLSRRES